MQSKEKREVEKWSLILASQRRILEPEGVLNIRLAWKLNSGFGDINKYHLLPRSFCFTFFLSYRDFHPVSRVHILRILWSMKDAEGGEVEWRSFDVVQGRWDGKGFWASAFKLKGKSALEKFSAHDAYA